MVYTNGKHTFYTALNPAYADGIVVNKKMLTYVWWKLCAELGIARTDLFGRAVAVPDIEDFVIWDPQTDRIAFEISCSDIRYVEAKSKIEKEYPGLFIWDCSINIPQKGRR